MSHTDAATIARLSPAAKRILNDWCWCQDQGLKEYHGSAGDDRAKYELRDAGCCSAYEVHPRGELSQIRIALGPKGKRIARKVYAGATLAKLA